MKRFIPVILLLLFGCASIDMTGTAGPPAPPPIGPNTNLNVMSISVGTPYSSTGGVAYISHQKVMTNSAGDKIPITRTVCTFSGFDFTDETEDATRTCVTYTMTNGYLVSE